MVLTASLAQGAPAGGSNHPFRVIDKRGKLVGYTVTENMVAREINGVWVSFYVHPTDPDGIFDSDAIYLNYLTTDCSGTDTGSAGLAASGCGFVLPAPIPDALDKAAAAAYGVSMARPAGPAAVPARAPGSG